MAGGIATGYRYNGLGLRVAKTGAAGVTVHYVYDEAGRLLGEYDGAGYATQETAYLRNLPIAVLNPGATTVDMNKIAASNIYYVYPDHLSTLRVLTRQDMWSWRRSWWRCSWRLLDPRTGGNNSFNCYFESSPIKFGQERKMRKLVIDVLEVGKTYFRLGYYDRNLSVPFLDTYVFVGKNLFKIGEVDHWFFQTAQLYLEGALASTLDECEEKGILGVPYESLDDLVDWDGLINELQENKRMQDQGKFLSQRC